MFRFQVLLACFLAMFIGAGVSGCGEGGDNGAEKPSGDAVSQAETPAGHAADHEHADDAADHERADDDVDEEAIAAQLDELSDEDRALAEKQRFCPISNDRLGEMGVPVKVDLDGRSIFICCASCKEDLVKDKEKHLAWLDEQLAKADTDDEE